MNTQQQTNALKRINEEFKLLNRSPLVNFGITVGLFENENLFEWKCTILGPTDTVYKGGLFYLKIIFPYDYPIGKPEILFLTPIYHLNVKFFINGTDPLGHICVNTLNQWKSGDSIKKILPELFSLLHKNNPDSPYDYNDHSRRNEFVNNRALFDKKAVYFTKKYANPYSNSKLKEYPNGWDFSYYE